MSQRIHVSLLVTLSEALTAGNESSPCSYILKQGRQSFLSLSCLCEFDVFFFCLRGSLKNDLLSSSRLRGECNVDLFIYFVLNLCVCVTMSRSGEIHCQARRHLSA